MNVSKWEIYAFLGVVLLIALGIAVFAYVQMEKANARADQVVKDSQAQIMDLRKTLNDQLSQISKDRQEVKTPQQIVTKLPEYIPLPKPIYIEAPQTSQASVPGSIPLPDAPQSLVIPAESVNAFWQHETDCKADNLKLGECTKEGTLKDSQILAYKVAAKGSFWSKFKTRALWLGIGSAAGYAIAHH